MSNAIATSVPSRLNLLAVMILLTMWSVVGYAQSTNRGVSHTQPVSNREVLLGASKVVALDYFYNHQMRDGKQVGYIWENTADDGYSQFGELWKSWGATLATLKKAPTSQDLNRFSVYIIVSPCTEINGSGDFPNRIGTDAIESMATWVHGGGILILFANNKDHCDFQHLNNLADKFGIGFNPGMVSTIPRVGGTVTYDGQQVRMGVERIDFSSYQYSMLESGFPDHPLFIGVKSIRINELCKLSAYEPAKVMLNESRWWPFAKPITGESSSWYRFFQSSDIRRSSPHPDVGVADMEPIMASSVFGKGLVFAVGGPLFYNQQLNASAAGADDTTRVAVNLVRWLLGDISPSSGTK